MKKLLKPLLILFTAIILSSCACMQNPDTCDNDPLFIAWSGSYNRHAESSDYTQPNEDAGILKSAKSTTAGSGSDRSGVPGIRAGIGYKVPLSPNFNLETGAFYAMKGSKLSDTNFEDQIKLSYIDIPLLAKYTFTESPFSIYGGLQPSVLLSGKQKLDFNGTKTTVDLKENLNKLDLAASLGVGYAFDNGFGIDLAYDLGLKNIYKDNYGGYELKNRSIRLGVRYTFKNKKQSN
ncbi:MAG: PorT family protein [Flavobacteriaceae bacterium]|nr:PorT family protein [Flavobacteriaceae bacterium]